MKPDPVGSLEYFSKTDAAPTANGNVKRKRTNWPRSSQSLELLCWSLAFHPSFSHSLVVVVVLHFVFAIPKKPRLICLWAIIYVVLDLLDLLSMDPGWVGFAGCLVYVHRFIYSSVPSFFPFVYLSLVQTERVVSWPEIGHRLSWSLAEGRRV